MKSEYTEADKQAWLAENPCDEQWWDAIPDTLGFQMFVMGRRARELGGSVLDKFETLERKVDEIRRQTIERYFRS